MLIRVSAFVLLCGAGPFAPCTGQTGTLDPDFQGDGLGLYQHNGANSYATRLRSLPDGKILVLGVSMDTKFIARHLPDGTIDIGFGVLGFVDLLQIGLPNGAFTSIAVDDEGRILICGDGNSTNPAFIARLGPLGNIDPTFGQAGRTSLAFMPDIEMDDLIVAPDGRILANFSTDVGMGTVVGVMRLLPDGQLDTSFSFDGAAWSEPGSYAHTYSMALQPDGRILFGGVYDAGTEAEHEYMQFVFRFNGDGTRDTGFGTNGEWTYSLGPVGVEWVDELLLRDNGGIVVSGGSNLFSLPTLLTALTTDGAPDPTFSFDGLVMAPQLGAFSPIALQADGKLIAVSCYEQMTTIRLNTDGSYDLGFGTNGTAAFAVDDSHRVWDCALQPDGKLLVAGASGDGWYMLARMLTGLDVGVNEPVAPAHVGAWPVPAQDELHVRSPFPVERFDLLDISGRMVRTWHTGLGSLGAQNGTLDLTGIARGGYILRLSGPQQAGNVNIIKQ